MGIEFVILQDEEHFSEFQILPEVYNQEAYHGNTAIYIISDDGYRFKVELVTPRYGLWYLTGPKWTEFCHRNLSKDVHLLHFIEEGEDSFYVTGYLRNGKEVAGYDGHRSTFSRLKTYVLPDPRLPQTIPAELLPGLEELDEVTIIANGEHYACHVRREAVLLNIGTFVYRLLGDSWNTMVEDIRLEAGTVCVITKNRGNQLWVDAFNADGSMITQIVYKGAPTLRKQQLPLEWHEEKDDRMKHICFWPSHMDHFGEYDRSFYKAYVAIQCNDRLAIPAKFLRRYPMHMYDRVLIIHREYRQEMKVRMEPHNENPERNNHVNVHGKWKQLASRCGFPYTKIIRFKYVSNGEDLDVEDGQNTQFPIFHIC